MKKLPLVAGLVMVVCGAVITFQGLGYLEGSPMTGSGFWAIAGPLVAGLGVSLLIVTVQNRRR